MLTPMTRYPFKHIENFRDLGGMPAQNGFTRWGIFYRCADLCHATKDEMDFIYHEMNVKTIIDLRAPFEIEAAPDPFMQDKRFTWIAHSLIGSITFEEDLGIDMQTPDTPTMVNFYKLILTRCQSEVKTLMSHLADAVTRGAVLFHCSAGKDRTGLTAMFLESLVGVPDKDIISQYEISRTLLIGYRIDDRSGSHFSNMENLLAYIKQSYGSPTEYLNLIGVQNATLETLRAHFLAPITMP